MSTEEPQSPDQQTDTAPVVPGSDEEAINAFNQRKVQAQSPETPEPEPQASDQQEPVEGEPADQEEPAEELAEVQYEGETFKVPPKLKDALLRQSDYSRRMGEVSDTKKDYAQRIERADKLAESAEARSKVLAEIQLFDMQLEQFKAIDLEKLELTDPSRAALTALKQLQLQRGRDQAVSKAQGIDTELAQGKAKDTEAKQAEMLKVLQKDFAGWNDEAGAKVTQYALKSGWSADELRSLTDPRMVFLLDKARKFDAIQDGKAAAQAKSKDAPPVAKPGAPRRPEAGKEVMQRFLKSTSPEDAEAVFKARAAARR